MELELLGPKFLVLVKRFPYFRDSRFQCIIFAVKVSSLWLKEFPDDQYSL